MQASRVLLAALLLLPLPAGAAEAPRPSSAFRFAYGEGSCAPWDGPAFRVVLQRTPVAAGVARGLAPALPQYNVTVWSGRPLVGRWIHLSGEAMKVGGGTITFCEAGAPCRALPGRVIFTRLTADRVAGELRVMKGAVEAGFAFEGPVAPNETPCG